MGQYEAFERGGETTVLIDQKVILRKDRDSTFSL
ncbi:MAG: hypothetical protein CM1200mP30_17830 [Pseudomonadota bacterium]|nr:MAG: hypothetical protein CM1200mP30_17830 [Pseudomonadota bacterium]